MSNFGLTKWHQTKRGTFFHLPQVSFSRRLNWVILELAGQEDLQSRIRDTINGRLGSLFRRYNPPSLFQRAVLYVLLMLTPYAMTFKPYGQIYQDGIWGTTFELDPLYWVRAGLIITGMVGATLSVILLIWVLNRTDLEGPDLFSQISGTLCSLSIGWVLFPYLVNGMFQAYIGNADVADFDPGALMPMIWIGDIWRIGVIFVYVLGACVAVPLIFGSIILIIRGKTWRQGTETLFYLAITATVIFCFPRYLEWLAD